MVLVVCVGVVDGVGDGNVGTAGNVNVDGEMCFVEKGCCRWPSCIDTQNIAT